MNHFWGLGTHANLGSLTWVTKAFGTHSWRGSFPFIWVPMNFASILPLLSLLNKKWCSLNWDLKLGDKVGGGRVGIGHSLVWCSVIWQCWQYEPTSLLKHALSSGDLGQFSGGLGNDPSPFVPKCLALLLTVTNDLFWSSTIVQKSSSRRNKC